MNVAQRIYSDEIRKGTLYNLAWDIAQLEKRGLKVGDVFRSKDIRTENEIKDDYSAFTGSTLSCLVNYGILEVAEKKCETVKIRREIITEYAHIEYRNEKGELLNFWGCSRAELAKATKTYIPEKSEIEEIEIDRWYNVYRVLTFSIADIKSNIANYITERVNA